MKTTRKHTYAALLLGSAIAATSAQAAVINIADYSVVPDGTDFGASTNFLSTENQRTDINAANGGSIVKSGDPVAYFVTTFVFGSGTSADINLNFTAGAGQERLGIEANPNGIFSSTGDATSSETYDIGSSLVGQTVTIIGKFEYDSSYSVLYDGVADADDTIATFWINPTGSSTEGSGLPDGYKGVANANYTGDLHSQNWNSSQYFLLQQRIENNLTLGTEGTSSIINTTVLTGTDATFANALALATIPEPSTALLGGLGLLALLRRRR